MVLQAVAQSGMGALVWHVAPANVSGGRQASNCVGFPGERCPTWLDSRSNSACPLSGIWCIPKYIHEATNTTQGYFEVADSIFGILCARISVLPLSSTRLRIPSSTNISSNSLPPLSP